MDTIKSTKVKQQLFSIFENDSDYQQCTKAQQNFPKLLKNWLSSVDLSSYIMDKKYLDAAWIQIDSEIYDNDSLWEDWKDFVESL